MIDPTGFRNARPSYRDVVLIRMGPWDPKKYKYELGEADLSCVMLVTYA